MSCRMPHAACIKSCLCEAKAFITAFAFDGDAVQKPNAALQLQKKLHKRVTSLRTLAAGGEACTLFGTMWQAGAMTFLSLLVQLCKIHHDIILQYIQIHQASNVGGPS